VFVPSTLNCTLATVTLSVAVAVTFTLPDTVADAAGDVIDTVGGVVSLVGGGVVDPLPLTTPEQPARPRLNVEMSRSAVR
jgi:hypothetical protein